MIKAIVYANRHRGFDLYEESLGFPTQYKSEIYTLSNLASGFLHDGPLTALRYAALQDRFLLQVILRFPDGNEEQSRPHHQVVSFLMETEDADALFAIPFTAVAGNAKHLAQTLLQKCKGADSLPEDLTAQLLADHTSVRKKEPSSALMNALWFGACQCGGPLTTQLFFATDDPAEPVLARLLDSLPPKLRKNLSFHTSITGGSDATGTVLHFTTTNGLARLREDGYAACPRANKYYYELHTGSNNLPREQMDRLGTARAALSRCEDRELLPLVVNRMEDLHFLLDAAAEGPDDLTRAIVDLAGPDFLLGRSNAGLLKQADIARYYRVAPKNKTIAALYQQLKQTQKQKQKQKQKGDESEPADSRRSRRTEKKKRNLLPPLIRRICTAVLLALVVIGIFLTMRNAVSILPASAQDGTLVLSLRHINSVWNDLLLLALGAILGCLLTVLLRRKK